MSTRAFQTLALAGGGDTQFSRPGFKITAQLANPNGSHTMTPSGYAYYRNQGVRTLWNFWNTSTRINPSVVVLGNDSAAQGVNNTLTSTTLEGGTGPSATYKATDYAPYYDDLFTDIENYGGYKPPTWDATDAVTRTAVLGNSNGADGNVFTVTSGYADLRRGDVITGSGFADDSYVFQITSGNVAASQFTLHVGCYYSTFTTPNIPNGTTVSLRGRIDDMQMLGTAAHAQLVTNGRSDIKIGAYTPHGGGGGTLFTPSYAWFNGSPDSYLAIRAANDACGVNFANYLDFAVPEFYTWMIDQIAGRAQWMGNEKARLGITSKLYPLIWPYQGSVLPYATCTDILEYMIRSPDIDGVAFWAVDTGGTHLPAAASPWYDDGNHPWMTAVRDFITKYGLSV